MPGWRISGLTTAARLTFAAVLLPYFIISAVTKFGGMMLSMGPDVPGTWLSIGAFYRFAPTTAEALMAGQALPIGISLFAHGMAVAELVLPVLISAGLATRFAAAAMILFITITTGIDISSHPEAAVLAGSMFDAYPFDELTDMRLLWAMLAAILLVHGAGPLSLDAGIGWLRKRRKSPTSIS